MIVPFLVFVVALLVLSALNIAYILVPTSNFCSERDRMADELNDAARAVCVAQSRGSTVFDAQQCSDNTFLKKWLEESYHRELSSFIFRARWNDCPDKTLTGFTAMGVVNTIVMFGGAVALGLIACMIAFVDEKTS